MTAAPGSEPARDETRRAAVVRTRTVLVGSVVGVLAVTAAASVLSPDPRTAALVAPATLVGLVSPVIGYRIYLWQRERLAAGAGFEMRCRAFFRATITAVAVAEAGAVFGLVAYLLSGRWSSLVGVVTLVTLAGAVWPSPERLDTFLEPHREGAEP